MKTSFHVASALVLVAAVGGPAVAQPAAPGRVIGGHQIDRYDAIVRVCKSLQANPNNLTDWVLLGELAQEVALEAPANIARGYYRLEREAFESALKLEPNNPQFKAAVEFARQQELGHEQFQRSRSEATTAYLEARRRELAQSGNMPTMRVYPAPPALLVPVFQPYIGAELPLYTYQQHYDSFFGPVQPRTPGQAITATERVGLVKPAARVAPP